MKKNRLFLLATCVLISLACVAYLGKSYENLLRGIDSNIHASVSLSVTSSGFLPHLPVPDPNALNKAEGQYFNDHPFFYFWVNGGIMRLLGPSGWSARILTGLFSVGCIGLTLVLGTMLFSEFFGFLAAVILLFTRDIILTGATVSLDPPLMFFILLSFVLWLRNNWIGVGLACGIGLWIKTPVVLLIFPTAVLIEQIRGNLKRLLPQIAIAFAFSLLLGSCVWIATAYFAGSRWVADYWFRQLWGTVVNGRNLNHGNDYLMYFRLIKNGFLPAFPLLIFSGILILKKKHWRELPVQICIAANLVMFVALFPMRFKMGYYYNPIFPFLSLFTAYPIARFLKKYEEKFYSGFIAFSVFFMSFLLCTPTTLGPEAFVSLKRFIPLIQNYGHCDDLILMVPGGEPVGSFLDYHLVLNFYTERRIRAESCESIGAAILKESPEWVILSRENFEKCLTLEEQRSFPTKVDVGNLSLLSRLIPRVQTIDLTPLERELKPVVDCQPQPYPKDMYHRY